MQTEQTSTIATITVYHFDKARDPRAQEFIAGLLEKVFRKMNYGQGYEGVMDILKQQHAFLKRLPDLCPDLMYTGRSVDEDVLTNIFMALHMMHIYEVDQSWYETAFREFYGVINLWRGIHERQLEFNEKLRPMSARNGPLIPIDKSSENLYALVLERLKGDFLSLVQSPKE